MILFGKRRAATTALLSLLLFAAPPAFSLGSIVDDDEDDKEEEEAEEEEEGDRWFAILGGDVYTGTGAILRGATVLSKNGKIEEIGYDLYLPEETETVDATGYRVYPGLVAIQSTSRISRGLFAAELSAEVDILCDHCGGGHDPDEHEVHGGGLTDPLHTVDEWPNDDAGGDPSGADDASFEALEETVDDDEEDEGPATGMDRPDFEHGYDPFNAYLVLALSAGITTADQSGTVAKLKRWEIDGVAMGEKHLDSVSWSATGRPSLREKFARASEYLREYREWEEKKKRDKDLKEPDKKGVDAGILAILRGETLARFSANDREELVGIARLAQQYGFRPVIQGCREGWTVADELGRAGAYAIVTPRSQRSKDERLVRPGGSSIENAAILHEHGVQVAIIPSNTSIDLGGITGRDLLHFPIEAGFAVRGGLSNEAALAGITMIPARLLGVDHRVGSLEVGKDCDAIITDGDVLHYQTFVQWTVVDGKVVYDKQDELLFHHIRPRPEPELEPEDVVDAEDPDGDAPEGEDGGSEDDADDDGEPADEGDDED